MTVSDSDFNTVMDGFAAAADIARGEADPATVRVRAPEKIAVRRLRKSFGLTQAAFAAQFGFTASAVKDWEQNR